MKNKTVKDIQIIAWALAFTLFLASDNLDLILGMVGL